MWNYSITFLIVLFYDFQLVSTDNVCNFPLIKYFILIFYITGSSWSLWCSISHLKQPGKDIDIWFAHLNLTITQREGLQLGNRFFKLVLVCYMSTIYFIYTAVIFLTSYNLDAILILEHSFYLSQHNDPQPFSAAQKYFASNTPARVGQALKDVFKQYHKAPEDEKINMVFNLITQNHMPVGELNICFNILFIGTLISVLPSPAAK